jgi:formylglycine-generating enzyme required for sulfatase activity
MAFVALASLGGLTLAPAQEPKAASGAKQITNSIGMKLALIPAGEFKMGSGESAEETIAFFKKKYGEDSLTHRGRSLTEDAFASEHPQHRVRITKSFYLGAYHVTRGQFRRFVKDTGYKTDAEKGDRPEALGPGAFGWDPEGTEFLFNKMDVVFNKDYSWRNAGFKQTDEHPVVNVSWNDAVAFCKWLSRKEGKTYRLPTEAEWEYACRAGTTTRYYSGDDPETLAKVANVADATFRAKFPGAKWSIRASDGSVFTSPVGSFRPNSFGLYDMLGNARQWCSDWHANNCYTASPADDPGGPDSGLGRAIRGGSWHDAPFVCRSAGVRGGDDPEGRANDAGFRVAMTR